MVAGVVIGAAVGLVLGAPLAFGVARSVSKRPLEGWRLEPVVVAAVDLEQGTTVTMEHLSQRSVPVRFTNAAAVRPDEVVKIIGARTVTALAADTSFSEWMVTNEPDAGVSPSCVEVVRALAADAGAPGVTRLIDALEAQRTTP